MTRVATNYGVRKTDLHTENTFTVSANGQTAVLFHVNLPSGIPNNGGIGTKQAFMSISGSTLATILVVDDVEEILDGIEKLLRADGYSVDATRSEERAVECARRCPPQLILLNLGGPPDEVVVGARRIRTRAQLDHGVPIVLFCIEGVAEGEEIHLGDNVYATHPDNFNQLRDFLARLLRAAPPEDRAADRTRS